MCEISNPNLNLELKRICQKPDIKKKTYRNMRFYYEQKNTIRYMFYELIAKNSIKIDCFPKSLFHFDIFFCLSMP